MRIVRGALRAMVIAVAILSIGVLIVPACFFLGMILGVLGTSEKLLELLNGRPEEERP